MTEKLKSKIEQIPKAYQKFDALVDSFYQEHLKTDKWMYHQFLEAWTHLENTGGAYKRKKLLTALKRFIPQDSKSLLKSKADKDGCLTLYRGTGCHPFGRYEMEYAISYTDDIDKARWFAKRFLCLHKTGFVIKRKVHINQIVAYTNDRQEKEMIIIPNKYDVYEKDSYKVIEILEYSPDSKGGEGGVKLLPANIDICESQKYIWDIRAIS
ncbi:hypothetical protein [Dehalobacter sp. TeCB1]|uniref:hypothetical protein n=1 Tax=Dehalobacter sp. TeCB1 TaxID=1843715 RepID=UPI00083B11F5|nr:hypothetical protein [Dehalobacter sp. TeCB1]OCZ49734.1 hypothetical protein A7D23_02580 [Dehalobacter sp. TeCB1]